MIGNNVLFTGRLACNWGTYKGLEATVYGM